MVVIHLAEQLLLSSSKTPSRLPNSVFPLSISVDSSAGKWESKTTLDESIIVISLLRAECTDITTRFTLTSELRVAEGGIVRLLITILGFVEGLRHVLDPCDNRVSDSTINKSGVAAVLNDSTKEISYIFDMMGSVWSTALCGVHLMD